MITVYAHIYSNLDQVLTIFVLISQYYYPNFYPKPFKNPSILHGLILVMAPKLIGAVGGGYCPDQALSIRTRGGTGEFPVGEISIPRAADSYGGLNSPWAPGHICGVSTMLVVVVVLLFSVLVQGLAR